MKPFIDELGNTSMEFANVLDSIYKESKDNILDILIKVEESIHYNKESESIFKEYNNRIINQIDDIIWKKIQNKIEEVGANTRTLYPLIEENKGNEITESIYSYMNDSEFLTDDDYNMIGRSLNTNIKRMTEDYYNEIGNKDNPEKLSDYLIEITDKRVLDVEKMLNERVQACVRGYYTKTEHILKNNIKKEQAPERKNKVYEEVEMFKPFALCYNIKLVESLNGYIEAYDLNNNELSVINNENSIVVADQNNNSIVMSNDSENNIIKSKSTIGNLEISYNTENKYLYMETKTNVYSFNPLDNTYSIVNKLTLEGKYITKEEFLEELSKKGITAIELVESIEKQKENTERTSR